MAKVQVHKNGEGYVVHDLTFNQDFCKLSFSVWYSAKGEVEDCKAFDSLKRPRKVPRKVKERLPVEFGYVVACYNNQTRWLPERFQK